MKSIGMTAEVLDYFHTLCRLGLLVDDIWNNIYCGKKEVQTLLDNLRPIHATLEEVYTSLKCEKVSWLFLRLTLPSKL